MGLKEHIISKAIRVNQNKLLQNKLFEVLLLLRRVKGFIYKA
jgi:hypothetical protein